MIELFIQIIVLVVIGGLIYYLLTLLPLPAPAKTVIQVLAILILILVLVGLFFGHVPMVRRW